MAVRTVAASSLYTLDGESVRINFHPGQTYIWDSRARFPLMVAGTQGGKTSFGPWWLNREIEWCGPGDYLGVTATFDLFKLKMLPEIRNVFEHILGIARYWSGDKVLELKDPMTGQFWARRADDPMWARVILRSASAAGGLESATAKAAWLDEVGHDDFTLEAWEAVLRRLSLNRGRALCTTTPYNLGWFKQQIYDHWRAGDRDFDVIQFKSTMNPAFPEEEFEDRKAKMQSWKFMMFYEGQFERPAGLIYRDFIDDYKENGGHLVRPFDIPQEWPHYVGVDPGAVNTAQIWLAHDPEENVYYLHRESLEGGMATGEHARKSNKIARDNGWRVIRYFVGSKSEEQQRMDWQAAGIRNVAAPYFTDVESGIDKVVELLRQFRLFVFDDCTGVRDELGRYSREIDDNGEVTEKIKDKEKFHRLDGLRYDVVGVTKPRARSEVW